MDERRRDRGKSFGRFRGRVGGGTTSCWDLREIFVDRREGSRQLEREGRELSRRNGFEGWISREFLHA